MGMLPVVMLTVAACAALPNTRTGATTAMIRMTAAQ
jgi:hypothetical protein